MTTPTDEHEITDDVIRNAAQNPNGAVYKIEGAFAPHEAVPPECIIGAWKVDAHGKPTGEFIKNPNYRPGFWKTLIKSVDGRGGGGHS